MNLSSVFRPVFIGFSLYLFGCSTMVSSFIEGSSSFDYIEIASDEDIKRLGFKDNTFCSERVGHCISYLEAEPLATAKLKYVSELESSQTESRVSLDICRCDLPREFSGTIVLLHGFRASKEFMLNSALYFRFLGFDVLVPDLLGHGKSGGKKTYGVGDVAIINELVDTKLKTDAKLYILGNSMGTVTASYLSVLRTDVSGILLQAPMLQFDQAVSNYINTNLPLATYFLTQQSITKGAIEALENADLTLNETNIKPLIESSKVPVIIFASESDSVAPYSQFEDMSSANVTRVHIAYRNHPSMAVIGQTESEEIIKWLINTSK